jgi:hypothetical protein
VTHDTCLPFWQRKGKQAEKDQTKMPTSKRNEITSWPAHGNSLYDAAAARLGEEVRCSLARNKQANNHDFPGRHHARTARIHISLHFS